MALKVNDWVHVEAESFVRRKYTTHADARQKEMGLSYVTAERDDLVREIAYFARAMIGASHAMESN